MKLIKLVWVMHSGGEFCVRVCVWEWSVPEELQSIPDWSHLYLLEYLYILSTWGLNARSICGTVAARGWWLPFGYKVPPNSKGEISQRIATPHTHTPYIKKYQVILYEAIQDFSFPSFVSINCQDRTKVRGQYINQMILGNVPENPSRCFQNKMKCRRGNTINE